MKIELPREPQRGLMRAVIVEQGPAVDGTGAGAADGTLDSPAWQQCPAIELGHVVSPLALPLRTTCRVLFDATRLYVAFDCEEPETDRIKAAVTERDGSVWQDDSVELFVSGDPRLGYYHFIVNAKGVLADGHAKPDAAEDGGWNSSAVVRTQVEMGKRWTATLAVPLAELGAFVGDGQTWLVNLNRTRQPRRGAGLMEWSWAILTSPDFGRMAEFGQVRDVRVPAAPGGVTRRASPPPDLPLPSAPGRAEAVSITAADAMLTVERRTGLVSCIQVGKAGEFMAHPRRTRAESPAAFVEVVDLHARRSYDPFSPGTSVRGWKAEMSDAGQSVEFATHYEGAPFTVTQVIRRTPAGVRWEARVRLKKDETECRSIRVNWLLPLPVRWRFWAPNDTVSYGTDEGTPRRAVYGNTYYQSFGTIIPLVGVWGRNGGAAVWSPPDVQKPQITFDVFTQSMGSPPRGIANHQDDQQMLKVGHQYVGLRPGRELVLAVCIAGIEPHWRAALGHYVGAYPELFEPIPATRKVEGMYGITGMSGLTSEGIDDLRKSGVTMLELHGSFFEYGNYLTPEAVANPDSEWPYLSNPLRKLSVAANRRKIKELSEKGIAPFMYFYNVHAERKTIDRMFASDLMLDEQGRPMPQWEGQPLLRAQPDGPFGAHLLKQADLMLETYPGMAGMFIDNFSIQGVDFAHDDGVTMVHDRPCYDLARNHEVIGPLVAAKAHAAGKIIMVNKLSTIESARGADCVLLEGGAVEQIKQLALACPTRAFFTLGVMSRGRDRSVERCMQYLMILGGTPDRTLESADPEAFRAYRPLTDANIGKRLAFDRDPVTAPQGFEGQVFRIDQNAAHAGDVVVPLVHLERTRTAKQLTEGLTLTVRLPEADRLETATWLGVENSTAAPKPCTITRKGSELTIALPPVGAAGVLRLSPRR